LPKALDKADFSALNAGDFGDDGPKGRRFWHIEQGEAYFNGITCPVPLIDEIVGRWPRK
jgi:hypothetical protein